MRLATPAIIPALLTPFDRDGAVDREALRAHVGWLIDHGVDGIMPCGTTGETALLSDDEVIEVIEAVVAGAGGRVPVIAHVGRPGTQPTIELGRRALEAGAAAVSAVVPYYHPLEPDMVLDHYRALIDARGAERVLAYCIPSHSNNVLDADGLGTLAREGLAGFKDSTMSASDHDAYVAALRTTGREDFLLLVGLGALLLRSLEAGSAGAVLGIANLRPELCVGVRDAFKAGRTDEAQALQSELRAAEEATMAFPDLKREVSERLRAEAGIEYGPLMRAPLGAAGRPVAQRA
jgi:dihydrodipicolinate synthase/N-acetylneuraminate lyase